MNLMRFTRRNRASLLCSLGILLGTGQGQLLAQSRRYLNEVPNYTWYAGCFGTASGNLMGYWDRNGMSGFYTGPTGGGLAPLESYTPATEGIRSMWASKAGIDGRPLDRPGHIDDYVGSEDRVNMNSYESTAADPYVLAGRPEHAADCIGDFIGLNQRKWSSLAGECDGNIDAYSFVFWDKSGARRQNYSFTNTAGAYVPDIQSGLKRWARSRGYDAEVFTQLSIFNPERTGPTGFTFNDIKNEIDSGSPILCFLQPQNEFYRNLAKPTPMRANPEIHGVMIYGYHDDPNNAFGLGSLPEHVLVMDSWGRAAENLLPWSSYNWLGLFPVRGVIGFHPKPRVTGIHRKGETVSLQWEGPSATITDVVAGTIVPAHYYQVERSSTLNPADFRPVTPPSTERGASVIETGAETVFYRIGLVPKPAMEN